MSGRVRTKNLTVTGHLETFFKLHFYCWLLLVN